MDNPERVKINEDKSLTVLVDENAYSFTEKQYLKSDKGKILLKHAAVMQLAKLTGVIVDEPQLLHTHNPSIYVFLRKATRNALQSFAAIGESNAKNLYDDLMKTFPAETADNRAYERAVLGILGLHGEIYGASEVNYKDNSGGSPPPSASKKEPKKIEKPENTETTEETQDTEIEKDSDGNPVWWDDLGIGVYTDKQLDPEILMVTEGPCKGKGWNIKQLYDYMYKSCLYFAERIALDSASEDFQKQVYSCRRAIRKYGMK